MLFRDCISLFLTTNKQYVWGLGFTFFRLEVSGRREAEFTSSIGCIGFEQASRDPNSPTSAIFTDFRVQCWHYLNTWKARENLAESVEASLSFYVRKKNSALLVCRQLRTFRPEE